MCELIQCSRQGQSLISEEYNYVAATLLFPESHLDHHRLAFVGDRAPLGSPSWMQQTTLELEASYAASLAKGPAVNLAGSPGTAPADEDDADGCRALALMLARSDLRAPDPPPQDDNLPAEEMPVPHQEILDILLPRLRDPSHVWSKTEVQSLSVLSPNYPWWALTIDIDASYRQAMRAMKILAQETEAPPEERHQHIAQYWEDAMGIIAATCRKALDVLAILPPSGTSVRTSALAGSAWPRWTSGAISWPLTSRTGT